MKVIKEIDVTMPVYDYKCKDHGLFSELATLADAEKPSLCPTCSLLSPRVICIPPTLLRSTKAERTAHETNERSQHEPVYSSRERRALDEEHASGCGCERKLSPSKLMYTARGEKMFPSARPWMISH